jgi:hypothetical protein
VLVLVVTAASRAGDGRGTVSRGVRRRRRRTGDGGVNDNPAAAAAAVTAALSRLAAASAEEERLVKVVRAERALLDVEDRGELAVRAAGKLN